MAKKQSGCLSLIFSFFGDSKPKKAKLKNTSLSSAKKQPEDLYRLRDDFLSPAEFSFYQVSKNMLKQHFVICPKVSLMDLFFVTQPQENMAAYNRINRKHVDFVICDPVKMQPLFAIELDDKSHQRENRRDRDRFVDTVFAQAELPLLHIPTQHTYNQQELGVLFKQALSRSRNYRVILATKKTHSENGATLKSGEPETVEGDSSELKPAPFCPKCGEQMILRAAQRGNHSGRQFYGCINYPKCRMVIPIEGG